MVKEYILELLQKNYTIEDDADVDNLNYIEEGYVTSLGLIQFMIELEEKFNIRFTDDELYMLSDGILALIRNTNQALQLTSDKSCIEALENLNKKYRELNTKICGMLE